MYPLSDDAEMRQIVSECLNSQILNAEGRRKKRALVMHSRGPGLVLCPHHAVHPFHSQLSHLGCRANGSLWWPASPLVKGFYEYLRRRAEVDKASLNRLRKQQREQLDRGESISPDKRIADDDVIDLPSHIIGIFERYFAFSLVLSAFGLEATVGTVLIAWIGAKQFAKLATSDDGPRRRTTGSNHSSTHADRADYGNTISVHRRFVWLDRS